MLGGPERRRREGKGKGREGIGGCVGIICLSPLVVREDILSVQEIVTIRARRSCCYRVYLPLC